MSNLVVDTEACVGCRCCVRSCSNGGIVVEDRKARVTASCVLCGLCVDACPVRCLSIEKGGATGPADLDAYRGVWVFAQVDDGEVAPVAFELLGKGRELADALGMELTAVLALPGADAAPVAAPGTPDEGGRAGRLARDLVARGADVVLTCTDARFAVRDAAVYGAWLADLVAQGKPAVMLMGATLFGRELAPAVAARVHTGLTADCTVLAVDPGTGLLQQTRPAFGGNLMATIVCPDHRPQMATVRPGVLAAPEPDPARTGRVVSVGFGGLPASRLTVLERIVEDNADAIADAEVLVVAGRGVGAQKNLALVRRLAELLGAKVGCSRPLVESGWCTYPHQVGQTGVSVAPKLLVSVGVSGAIQHLAGIGGAECVVAVNTDPDAPIFGVSRYAVVGDCVEVLKEWVALLESAR